MKSGSLKYRIYQMFILHKCLANYEISLILNIDVEKVRKRVTDLKNSGLIYKSDQVTKKRGRTVHFYKLIES